MIRRKRKVYLVLCMLIIVIVLYNWREAVDKNFLNLETCPACFGENQCSKILRDNHVTFIGFSKWKIFNKLLNVKNVYYGQTKARSYVLKKLAHDSELRQFDLDLCRMARATSPCNVSKAISSLLEPATDAPIALKKFNRLFKRNDVMKCNQDQIVQFLFKKYSAIDSHRDNLLHFVTLMALNPEPIILQAFHDIFPLPLFLGSCGRVIVEEYAGNSLSNYYGEPWLVRAKLAVQLLKMAISMSENEIRMYITDPSSDNFAISNHGTLKLIDAENVVLLDSRQEGLAQVTHFNDGIGCKNCFSFDYEELCGNIRADHNYFAICKGLLSSNPFSSSLPGGLLHSIPSLVEKQLNISSFIEECAMPTKTRDRRSAAKELLHHLLQLIQLASFEQRNTSELRK